MIGDIALIIFVSALLSVLARRCGQQMVIGQILTGVMLGPSLIGRLPGDLTAHLFPHAVLLPLSSLAQVAVVTFMFTVGYELRFSAIRTHQRAVPLVAAALAVPMSLGIACVLMYRSGFAAIGEPGEGRTFVLFVGVATSITAMLGLQPVFGGFLAGLTMRPRNGTPDADVLHSMESVGNLLLPLFFIVTGLSLDVGDVHGDALILLALIVFIASRASWGRPTGRPA